MIRADLLDNASSLWGGVVIVELEDHTRLNHSLISKRNSSLPSEKRECVVVGVKMRTQPALEARRVESRPATLRTRSPQLNHKIQDIGRESVERDRLPP